MKKRVGLIIGVLFGLNIVLVVFMILLLTGVIGVNSDNKDNKSDEDIVEENINVDNDVNVEEDKDNEVFVITYKDEVFEQKIGNGSVKNTRNLPVIKSDKHQDVADKIVNYLTNISDENWKYVNEFNDGVESLPYNIGVSYLFSTVVNNGKILSVDYMMSGSMGGVSWPGIWGYNFNVKTGDVLNIDDVLVANGKNEMTDYVLSDIEKNYDSTQLWQEGNPEGNWETQARKNIFGLGSWYFTSEGITVTFDKYLLGHGATGVVVVDIPKEKVNSYLKDDYKID